jgi:signal recognition particle receptor subunit beta
MVMRAGIVRRQRATVQPATSRPLKVVITGPFAAGKTTLIRTISEVAIVGTEREVTDSTREQKSNTTVAMDFGRITFAEDLSLFLFGTPGQRRFEVMWEVLSEGMIGFILMINAADDRSLEEGRHILETFRQYADVPFVVGVTHLDEADQEDSKIIERIRSVLELEEHVDVVPCDPRSREDVKSLLLNILMGVLRRLEDAETTS